MGSRKVTVKQSVAESIAAISWFIESQGMIATAEKFVDDIYDFFIKLSDDKKSYPFCREKSRAALGINALPIERSTPLYLLKQTPN